MIGQRKCPICGYWVSEEAGPCYCHDKDIELENQGLDEVEREEYWANKALEIEWARERKIEEMIDERRNNW